MNLLREADVSVKESQWDREGHRGMEISGRTVAFRIRPHGQRLRREAPFGCRLLACDPYRDDHDGALGGQVEAVDLTTLQREADILSLHCNLTPQTRGLVDRNSCPTQADCADQHGPWPRRPDRRSARRPHRRPRDRRRAGCLRTGGDSFETVANEGDAVWTRLMAHPRQVSPRGGLDRKELREVVVRAGDKVLAEFGG